MKKLIVAIFASVCLISVVFFLGACGGFGGSVSDSSGEGGGSSIISISTAEDLYALGGSNKSYKLTADIDLVGAAWTPISSFSGTLDGDGHKILNFTVSGSNGNFGFFNTLGGTVKNLTLENATVTATGTTGYAGVLCGQSNKAMFENITVGGTVMAKLMTNVGGMVGYAADTVNLNNCNNHADVTGYENVGGLAGYLTKLDYGSTQG